LRSAGPNETMPSMAWPPGSPGFQYLPYILEPSQFPFQEELFSAQFSPARWHDANDGKGDYAD